MQDIQKTRRHAVVEIKWMEFRNELKIVNWNWKIHDLAVYTQPLPMLNPKVHPLICIALINADPFFSLSCSDANNF